MDERTKFKANVEKIQLTEFIFLA